MSIASQIERINQNIADAYTALAGKGATLPQAQNSSNLATAISSVTSLDEYLEGNVVNYTGHATEIVDSAFRYTSSLVSVNLPDVLAVRRYGFANCRNLVSVRLDSCTYLHTEAFYDCVKLTSVYAPALVNAGGTYSAGQSGNFTYCSSLKVVDFPELTYVGVYEFQHSGVTTVNLPKVTHVYYLAFADCQSLKYIRLPSVTTIDSQAFSGSANLERVELPVVTSHGLDVYSGCTALKEVVIGTRLQYASGFTLPSQTILYVNDSDLSWYQSQTGWSDLYSAGRIKPVSELPSI